MENLGDWCQFSSLQQNAVANVFAFFAACNEDFLCAFLNAATNVCVFVAHSGKSQMLLSKSIVFCSQLTTKRNAFCSQLKTNRNVLRSQS